jgi:hypothetical protein
LADPTTFADQAIEHMRSLYSSALRKTGNVHGAEDLVQETYLKAYRINLEHFEHVDNLRWGAADSRSVTEFTRLIGGFENSTRQCPRDASVVARAQ